MRSDAVAASTARTAEMKVARIGFLLDRLGQDCSPLQFLRELTQNSIEAISRTPEKTGEVIWDVDWNRYSLSGTYNLACIDTGVGMTGEEMCQYINQLSSSMQEQAYDANFGVGAKVAAATRNHEGLIYLSWQDGQGYMIHLWRDPSTLQYGLRPIVHSDGSVTHWALIDKEYDAEIKPKPIRDHGTMVVLLGNASDDNTMLAPEGTPSQSRWVSRYLNTRYYSFPEGMTVRAREGWESPREDKDRNILRGITGQKPYLDGHAESHGTVSLTGANAGWWILRDEAAMTKNSGHIASGGHVAALFQNELYEMGVGRSGVARLQQFGVIFGYQRVVIYVEPVNGPGNVVLSNTARTHLLLNGEPLPWAEWAAEFRADMPEDIKQLMDDVTAGAQPADHRQAIQERLKKIRDLLHLSRYRRASSGSLTVSGQTPGGDSDETDNRRSGHGRGGGAGGRAGDIYALFVADEGDPGEQILESQLPEVKWVSIKEGSRTSDLLEDRAANYLPELNLIMANRDFRVYQDMIDRWVGRYAHVPGARPAIQETVEEWFEQALIETIVGVQGLKGSPQWTFDLLAQAWSEEALTASVMQRYHVDLAVGRMLGARLGSIRDREQIAV